MKKLWLFGLLLVMSLAMACGPANTVRLLYSPADQTNLPRPGAPRVAVVMLTDKRTTPNLGIKSDGSAFVSNTSVADWVSRSVGEELTKLGPQVSYSTSMAAATAAKPDYIISGTINEVWLKENNPTSLEAIIRISISLANNKGVIYSENLRSAQQKQGLPRSTAADSLLADTLRETLAPAMAKLNSLIK